MSKEPMCGLPDPKVVYASAEAKPARDWIPCPETIEEVMLAGLDEIDYGLDEDGEPIWDDHQEVIETVTDPSHYHTGGCEPIDLIRSANLNFLEGNIVKYVARWRRKGGIADLEKAKVYLNWLLEDAYSEEVRK